LTPLVRRVVWALIGALCFYRLAVAKPQPLDAAGTLRPLLYGLFSWFLGRFPDRDTAGSAWYAICIVVMLVPPALAILFYLSPRVRVPAVLRSRWLFWTSIAAALLFCRFTTLLEFEFNPDEGQFLASAQKLFYDPNFFHAVDTGTSGPINIYPLMLPAILGFSPDFASSRMLVIAIILVSAFLLYRSIACIATEELARLAILPFIGAFAVFKDRELIHYSSEHVPLLLISLAFYLSVRIFRDPSRHATPVILLGLLVSAAFFAKMQSVPIVAAEAVVALACVYATGHAGKVWRPALLLVAGGLPLPLLNTIACVGAGIWNDFWMSYIRANSSYADTHSTFVGNLQGFIQYVLAPNEVLCFLFVVMAIGVAWLVGKRGSFVQLTVVSATVAAAVLLAPLNRLTLYAFLGLLAICVLPVAVVLQYRRGAFGADPVRWFGVLSLASLAAAVFSVYVAHHAFVHYLVLLFLPLCACLAWMLIRNPATPLLALMLVLVVAYQCYLWSFQDDHVFRDVVAQLRPPEGELIRSLTSPTGRIFVWGWTVRPFLASGRVPSTRDTNVSNCFRAYNLMASPPVITPTPASQTVSRYYEQRILADLRASSPELFIDAVGPTSWFLGDRKYYGFEQFPDIAAFVQANYVFLKDQFDQRYYQRRDLASVR